MLLGKGEEAAGGRNRLSILGDAMEAVLGAVYLDGVWNRPPLILRLWEQRIEHAAVRPGSSNYKSRLQELLASRGTQPEYGISSEGPAHQTVFTAVVSVDGIERGSGTGPSKKQASKAAARAALEVLTANPAERG